MALLAGGAARRESVTIDEVAHVGAGVSYLQKLDMRMNEEHPPLAKVMAALPLVLRGVHADYSHVSWTFSNKFFYHCLGPRANVADHSLAGTHSLYLRLAPWWLVGRIAMSLCLRNHSGLYCIWSARNYRHPSYPLLGVDNLAPSDDVAFSFTRNNCEVWSRTRRRSTLEVFGWLVVFCIYCLCAEPSIQAPPWTTDREIRTASVAPPGVAQCP